MPIDWTKPLQFGPNAPAAFKVIGVIGKASNGKWAVEYSGAVGVSHVGLWDDKGENFSFGEDFDIANLPPKPVKRWVNILRAYATPSEWYAGNTLFRTREEAESGRPLAAETIATVEVEFVEPSG